MRRCRVCDTYEAMGFGKSCPCKHVEGRCVNTMADEGRMVALVVALAGSLKGVAEVVRALRERSRVVGLTPEAGEELAEALARCQREAQLHAKELAEALGAPI